MKVPNVHEGDSNKGNYNSRGSQGCITLNPEFSDRILDHFVWDGNTGNSTGSVIINRSGNTSFPDDIIQMMQLPLSGNIRSNR